MTGWQKRHPERNKFKKSRGKVSLIIEGTFSPIIWRKDHEYDSKAGNKKDHWRLECDISGCRSMEVRVCFDNQREMHDETEFCINPFDVDELQELLRVFCVENGFRDDTEENVCVVAAYPVKPEAVSDYLNQYKEGKKK